VLPITYNTAKSWRGLPTDSAADNAVKDSTISCNSKGLNQIGWVCASSAKRDFASKLSRLLTAFSPVTARVRYRANKSTLGVVLAIAPIA